MNLREEIHQLLYDYKDNTDIGMPTGLYVNDILKLFEKRIDEQAKRQLPDDIINSNLSTDEKSDLMIYRMALNDVKEILNDQSN